MPISVLLVEDQAPEAETIRSTCATIEGLAVNVESRFANALTRIRQDAPDVVVLDLWEDALAQDQGSPIWAQIWETQFCPLIFHTAHPQPADMPADHPFVKYVKKAPGSDRQVAEHLKTFQPHVLGVQRLRGEVAGDVRTVLKGAAPAIWSAHPDPLTYGEVLARTLRRRIAASLDSATAGATMSHWEQYVSPCLGARVLMGDVLMAVGGAATNPEDFRLNLTPSCDVAQGKVVNLLVAQCRPPIRYLRGANLHNVPEEKRRERLPSLLTTPQQGGFIILPGFGNILPVMAASLRELELIPVANVGNPGTAGIAFQRVASIDSPFREKVLWAHMQISGPPATPDCDGVHLINALAPLPRIQ